MNIDKKVKISAIMMLIKPELNLNKFGKIMINIKWFDF